MTEDVTTEPARPVSLAQPRPSRRWVLPAVGVVLVACVGVAWWALAGNAKDGSQQKAPGTQDSSSAAGALHVDVMRPRPTGLGRRVTQPGLVHAFDKASLYAKVSGYLIRQRVDIGDLVKKGDVLAEVEVPELFKSRDQARAALGQMQAKVKLAEAKVRTFTADRETAAAAVTEAEANLAKFTADRVFRFKERDRIAGLVKLNAVQQEILDEKEQQYEAALASERSGTAAIATAKAAVSAADARIAQARADLDQARADVVAAQADLDKAQVFVDYTKLTSPYDGVVTKRDFHNGDFIRSAADGGTEPVLAVARTDLMRVVIMVPDLDVPFVDRGDPATIEVDALAGEVFKGKVARFANSETELKLMRTEVDLPNPDNRLRDGMYGTARIEVERPSKNVAIPSTALIEQDEGNGAVYIVRDGKVHRQTVRVGHDDGGHVEILSGLSPDDQVIVRYNGAIAEGLVVNATVLPSQP